jgi:hypothetical protein
MLITFNEFWTIIHGLSVGGLLLLVITAYMISLLYTLTGWLTDVGKQKNIYILKYGAWLMFILTWCTIIVGTYIVYPWYRAKPPEGADLALFPRAFLLANPQLSGWHNFGMEWKEHVAWLSPMLVTAVAFIIANYKDRLLAHPKIVKALMTFIIIAAAVVVISIILGALINKAAPVR